MWWLYLAWAAWECWMEVAKMWRCGCRVEHIDAIGYCEICGYGSPEAARRLRESQQAILAFIDTEWMSGPLRAYYEWLHERYMRGEA